jgi:hypothetical protein
MGGVGKRSKTKLGYYKYILQRHILNIVGNVVI